VVPSSSSIITRPALSGYCGVIGCDSAADIETVSRRGESTYTVSKSCIDHASRGQLAALSAQGMR
jgi:hypothetical protein